MASIDVYAKDPLQALIDAAAEPALRKFIEPSDLELVTVNLEDGTQAQVQALARGSVPKVVHRLLVEARRVGIDIKDWICSPSEFNLCSKLNTPVGERMRQLNEFLKRKWTQGGVAAAGLVALFTTPAVGAAIAIFSALGFVNNVFVELCECPISA